MVCSSFSCNCFWLIISGSGPWLVSKILQCQHLYKLVIWTGYSWLYGHNLMNFNIVPFKLAYERELPMSHVLFAGYYYPEPGAKETDLFSVITVLFIALCNRSTPNINTLSSPWVGINPVTFKYIHATCQPWRRESRVLCSLFGLFTFCY